MDKLFAEIQNFYRRKTPEIYAGAKCLRFINGRIEQFALADAEKASKPVEVSITRIDTISDRLAYAQTEYLCDDGFHRDVLGLISIGGKWQLTCVVSAISAYRFGNLYTSPERQTEDLQKIEKLLLRYCHDVYQMNAEDCLSLFWDNARMYHPNEDESFTDVPIQELHVRWADHPDPSEKGITEFSRLYHVEMLNADIAIAKIGCAKMDNYFNDYLTLMRLESGWRIVNKMTHRLYVGERI